MPIEFAKDVVGIITTLGKVGGLDTMMAIACKTLKGFKALETYDKEGRINKSTGLHMLGSSIGRHMDGRYVVICLEELRQELSFEVWNWFQNRRYATKSKLVQSLGKLSVSSPPWDDSVPMRNKLRMDWPIAREIMKYKEMDVNHLCENIVGDLLRWKVLKEILQDMEELEWECSVEQFRVAPSAVKLSEEEATDMDVDHEPQASDREGNGEEEEDVEEGEETCYKEAPETNEILSFKKKYDIPRDIRLEEYQYEIIDQEIPLNGILVY
ncbi:hypothetical protein GIB67_011577 [Kingdonia uniflora]|uniref:Uncharacterized protein n=1 Tax=Kingdonia uniflora TaxID=39325 RepID=A0A7J7NML4_9MAGN|nr:hypothetical protein GIB67_011577 [Kingdonia uniflora]